MAQFVKNFNASEHKEQFPEAFDAIVNNHYVDDYLDSSNTIIEAVNLIKQVIQVHSCDGFKIRSFISNNRAVLDQLPQELVDEHMLTDREETIYQKCWD